MRRGTRAVCHGACRRLAGARRGRVLARGRGRRRWDHGIRRRRRAPTVVRRSGGGAFNAMFAKSSMAREKAVVVVVVPDPEPDDSFALKKADRSMVARNTNGIDRACLADPLELKSWMSRVEREGSVRVSSLVLNFRWELAEEFPEPWVRAGSHILSGSRGAVRPAASSLAASSARAFKTSWDCANR